MAKRKQSYAARPATPGLVVVQPSRAPARRRSFSRGVTRFARKRGRSLQKHAPTLGIGLGAAALGYLDGAGHLDVLPAIGGSRMTTLGLVGYGLTRFSRDAKVRAVGLAALAAGAYDFGRDAGVKAKK